MKLYYFEKNIDELENQTGLTRKDATECAMNYFKDNFTTEELLELILRGQEHANNDKRVEDDYFNR